MNLWSTAGILEKNKLANDKPFLIVVEIVVEGIDEPIRLVRDNVDCEWNGETWQQFPFDFDNLTTQDGKEIPSVNLKVSNVQGLIQGYVQRYRGFCDAKVKVMVIHAAHLDNTIPEIELDFVVKQTSYTEEWVTFSIGASNDHSFRFPIWRYMTKFCPFRFKNIQCGYNGSLDICDNTLATCRIPKRFGGEPGLQNSR